MEASSTKAEPPRPAVAEPAQPGSGVLRKLRAGLLALLVLAALVWGYFWQKPPVVGPEAPGLAAWFLSPQAHPMIGSAPVVRGGRDGGFIPRRLCASSVDEAAVAACVVYPDGRLFLPRTDRGPRFVSQLLYDPETSTALALSLYRETFLFGGRQGQPEEQVGWQKFAEPVPLPRQQVDEPERPDSILFEHGNHSQMAVSSDGTRLAVARFNGEIELWDADNQELVAQLNQGFFIGGRNLWVGFSPDASHIIAVGRNGQIAVWDTESGVAVVEFSGHFSAILDGGHVSSAGFTPRLDRLVTYATDGTISFWDVSAGTETSRLALDGVGVEGASISPNGRFLAALDSQRNLHLWDLTQDNPSPRQIATDVFWLGQHAFSSDGEMLAFVGNESLQTQLYQHQRDNPPRVLAAESMDAVYEAHFLPGGKHILQVGPHGEMEVHDVTSGGIRTMPLNFIAERGGGVVQFAPEAGLVALSSEFGLFVVIDLLLPSLAVANPDTPVIGGGLAFLPSTRSIVIDVPDSGIRFSASPFGRLPNAIGFAENGRLLSVGPSGFLASLELEQEGPGWQRHAPGAVTPIDFHAVHSRNGISFAVGSAQTVARERQPGDWQRLQVGGGAAVGAESFRAVFVGPDRLVHTAGDNGTIFASADQGDSWTRQHSLPGLTIDALYVSEDGSGWASGLRDGRIVWLHSTDATQGNWRQLHSLPAPWWFALLILGTPLALRANARAWVDTGPRVEQSIADRAVNDQPLDWNGVDALGLKSIARSLSRFLRNTDTKPPLTIAVTGRWGSGKSSLMNLLHLDLQRRGASTVWFNAWHHRSEDHLFAALMEAIRTEGVPSAWSVRGFGFRLRLLRHRNRQLVAVAGYLGILAAMALGFFLAGTWLLGLNLAEQVETFAELHVLIPDLEGLPSWLGSLLSPANEAFGPILGFLGAGVALWLWVKATLPFPVKPAALIAQFTSRTSVSGFSERLGFRHHFGKAFGEVATVMRRPTSAGLVIFIDDLDRCHPEHVLSVLEAVNFVVNAGPCIVVLGMDRQQVEHAVGLGFAKIAEGLPDADLGLSEIDGDADKDPKARENRRNALKREAYARRYMEKLVNLEVVIPTMRRTAVGLMVSGPQLGSDAEQTAAVHDPGKLHRRLLPFWNGLGWVLPRAGLAFLVAAALVFVTVPGPPRDATEAGGQLSPTESGVPDPPLPPDPGPPHPDPSPEPDPPEPVPPSPRGAPVPLQLAADPEAHPVPAWGIWLTAFVAMALLLLLVLSRLIASRATIRRDSPEFRRALAIVEPLLAREGVTPRDIRRWENRMRFLAERQRVEQQQTDSLEMVLERMGRLLGIALVASRTAQGEAVVPEPTLIALGALEFSFPDLTGAENAKPFSERLSGLESEGRNQLIQKSRAAFELEFTEQPLHYWPDDRAAAKYQQIRTGA